MGLEDIDFNIDADELLARLRAYEPHLVARVLAEAKADRMQQYLQQQQLSLLEDDEDDEDAA